MFEIEKSELSFDEELEELIFNGCNKLLYNTVHMLDIGRHVDYKLLEHLPPQSIKL